MHEIRHLYYEKNQFVCHNNDYSKTQGKIIRYYAET